MRIAHLVPHLAETGNGVVNAFLTLAHQQLGDSHYEIAVISRGGQLSSGLTSRASLYTIPETARLPELRKTITGALREWRPDIIHVHTVGMLIPILSSKIKRSTPTITTAHSLFRRLEYLSLCADATVAVSEANARRLRRVTPVRGHVHTIYNAVEQPKNIPVYESSERYRNRLLFVGGLFKRKGAHILLEALRLLHDTGIMIGLDILGDGPQRQEIEAQVHNLGLQAYVSLHGFVARTEDFYRTASALVHPAFEEPFGLVLAEAEQYKLPIIASAVGGIPEVLAGGHAGTLVRPGEPEMLAHAITAVLQDPKTAQHWSDKSATASQRWAPRRMFDAYDALYKSVLDKR